MAKALLIAEKPSLMRQIQSAYENNKSKIPYEISTFLAQRGHLVRLQMPNEMSEDLKKWNWEQLPIEPEKFGGFKYVAIHEKSDGVHQTSQKLLRNIYAEINSGDYDFIIHAGDADQEGELLVDLVLKYCKNQLPVKRYWANTTVEADIKDALINLLDDDHNPMLLNLRKAAYARQHSDYRFGINLSRAASLKCNYKGLPVAMGRVMSTILGMVCQRELEIENFSPSTVYGIGMTFITNTNAIYAGQLIEDDVNEQGESIKTQKWFDTKEDAENYIKKYNTVNNGVILNKIVEKKNTYAPKILKLSSAQVEGSKLGFSASEVLEIIQSLYESGYVTYPRTDCEYISSKEDFRSLLCSANTVPFLQPYISGITADAIENVKTSKKWVNDKALLESGHSGLLPTTKAPDYNSLTSKQQQIYQMICTRFVSIFLPPIIEEITTIETSFADDIFISKGKKVLDYGFAPVFNVTRGENILPDIKENDIVEKKEAMFLKKTSQCPKRFDNGSLIAACEVPHKFLTDKSYKDLGKNLKIGTPATRASIIDKLIKKDKYLTMKKKYIVPTALGMEIYKNFNDLAVFRVDMTGKWEIELDEIRKGQRSEQQFNNDIKCAIESIITSIKNRTVTTTMGQKSAKPDLVNLMPCPSCGGNLYMAQKGYFCSNWNNENIKCKVGLPKNILGFNLQKDDFCKLINGDEIIAEMLSKTSKRMYKRKIKYDLDECKLVFGDFENTTFICPICNSTMHNNKYNISCDCGLKINKEICKRQFSDEEILTLLKEKKLMQLSGFYSETKKRKFKCNVVLDIKEKNVKLQFNKRR